MNNKDNKYKMNRTNDILNLLYFSTIEFDGREVSRSICTHFEL